MSSGAVRPATRSYHQYCGLARGLDMIGDRWTLLIIRELLLGPKRYKDMLEGLPGIGTNLLASRLRELQEMGVARRGVLAPPAGSAVYTLTECGQQLEPVLSAMGRWGAQFLGPVRDDDFLVPSAYFVAMRATFRPELAVGMNESFEFRMAGRVFWVKVQEGSCSTGEGQPGPVDVVFTLDATILNALLVQGLSPRSAIRDKGVKVEGDPEALDRFVQVFRFRLAQVDR
jgi:DNA-binding HxlR family transcriptional regulator